jgi:hypothetical protein
VRAKIDSKRLPLPLNSEILPPWENARTPTTYREAKVVTERGATWMIDCDSFTATPLASDPQPLLAGFPEKPYKP